MPEQARKLTELLEEKAEWNREVGLLFRSARGGTPQVAFAATLDISQGYLSQIENGVRTPSSETLSKLSTYVEGGADGDSNQDAQDED